MEPDLIILKPAHLKNSFNTKNIEDVTIVEEDFHRKKVVSKAVPTITVITPTKSPLKKMISKPKTKMISKPKTYNKLSFPLNQIPIGRNALCVCGSGHKFKSCCMYK